MIYPEQFAIIFDLDMTLVDTSALEELRSQKKWQKVYEKFDQTHLFPKVTETINHFNIYFKIGVVTSSPRPYAEKLLQFHNLDIPVITAFHDTKNHKPFPDPLLDAIDKLKINPRTDAIINIGDKISDIAACHNANARFGLKLKGCAYTNQKVGDNSEHLPFSQHCLGFDYHEVGFNPVGVTWGNSTSTQLINSGAIHVIYDFDDFINMCNSGYGMGDEPPELIPGNKQKIINVNNHWSVINYFPTNLTQHDKWSKSILEFKDGNYSTVKKWAQLVGEQVDELIRNREFDRIDFIVRALSSNETSPIRNHPLDEVCNHLARNLNAGYTASVIKKKRPSRQLKYLRKQEREIEIRDNYYCDWSWGVDKNERFNILIVDDILTTGLTSSSIAKELKDVLPNSTIYLITLGKTSRPEYGGPSDNSHMKNIYDITVKI